MNIKITQLEQKLQALKSLKTKQNYDPKNGWLCSKHVCKWDWVGPCKKDAIVFVKSG